MRTTVVIAEYNPMTNGHVYHLETARKETNADSVIVLMSGSFTQRGDAAVADKYIRAEIAVKHGADMVAELPTVYAVSPADNFAEGAIKTISVFPGELTVSFGSECGDLDTLTRLATLLAEEPEDFKTPFKESLAAGNSFPKARADGVRAYCAKHEEAGNLAAILDEPNNVLGIAYIQAAKKSGVPIKFHTVRRVGSGYNDLSENEQFPSSTAVREAAFQGNLSSVKDGVPKETYDILQLFRPNPMSLGDMVLFRMKNISGYDLEHYYDVSGGIHNRLKIAAATANSYEQMLEEAKTKKYTMARLKRISLYALFDITKDFYIEATKAPAYVQILALNSARKDLLSALSENTKNVLTRYSDVGKVDKCLRPFIKLDFTAQGTLEIINRSNYYNKKMLLVNPEDKW